MFEFTQTDNCTIPTETVEITLANASAGFVFGIVTFGIALAVKFTIFQDLNHYRHFIETSHIEFEHKTYIYIRIE